MPFLVQNEIKMLKARLNDKNNGFEIVKLVTLSLECEKHILSIYKTQNEGKALAVLPWNVPNVEYCQNYLWCRQNNFRFYVVKFKKVGTSSNYSYQTVTLKKK